MQVLSPLGEVFPNKGRAIAHMVSNGFPEQQVSNGQYTVRIFGVHAKSENFPGSGKFFCCGKIPIKNNEKIKN